MVKGNMVATDGNKKFTVSINDDTNYIVGGEVGGMQYYTHLQITVEEDDGTVYSTC